MIERCHRFQVLAIGLGDRSMKSYDADFYIDPFFVISSDTGSYLHLGSFVTKTVIDVVFRLSDWVSHTFRSRLIQEPAVATGDLRLL